MKTLETLETMETEYFGDFGAFEDFGEWPKSWPKSVGDARSNSGGWNYEK